MFHPVLSLLVAGSIHVGADLRGPADLAQIVLEITEALPGGTTHILETAAEPTVIDVPYYYSDFTPIAAPVVAQIVTYDWRSPVIFDLP
jgi:hypothetical protein